STLFREKVRARVALRRRVSPARELRDERRELVPERLVARREEEVGLEPVDRVADVVAARLKDDAVDRLALEQELERGGGLEVAALAGPGLFEAGEDLGREHVPRGDREAAGGLLGLGFFDQLVEAEDAVPDARAADDAVAGDLLGGYFLQADDGGTELPVGLG